MTKDKKGITLVSLVITIIVMLIIFGVTITSGTVLLDNSKKTKIETSLYMVKARAETLLEQYMFDGDVKSLLSFSKLEKKNTEKERNPVGYSIDSNYFSYTIKSGVEDVKISLNVKNTDFNNKIGRNGIYRNLFDRDTTNGEWSETKEIEIEDKKSILPRFLFVKWGWDECVSQGIYKETVNGKKDNDSIVNDNDYIIVVYDLFAGNVDVAYSKGYMKDGKVYYTLDSMLKMDEEEE